MIVPTCYQVAGLVRAGVPGPILLVARASKVYLVPALSPVMVQVVFLVLHVLPPGEAMTV